MECAGPHIEATPCNGTFIGCKSWYSLISILTGNATDCLKSCISVECYERDVYYASGNVFRVYTHVASPRVCASKCAMHPTKCNFWIYSPPTRDHYDSVSVLSLDEMII